jgi:hypothetical protein
MRYVRDCFAEKYGCLCQSFVQRGICDLNLHPSCTEPSSELPTLLPPPRLLLLETPVNQKQTSSFAFEPSVIKGVVLTTTGEPLATPTPAELAKLFIGTLKVGLNFSKIFDHDDSEEEEGEVTAVVKHDSGGEDEGVVFSPFVR